MLKKNASQLVLFLMLIDSLIFAFNVQPVGANVPTYTIKADGSIDPPTSQILRSGDVYTFTSDISGSIIVKRDNTVVNGAGHTLQGTGFETGIDLSSRTNVTIQNMAIKTFDDALYLHSSNQITISGTKITDSTDGIRVSDSSNDSIYENNITGNSYEGIYILASSNNTISENNITANTGDGVYLWGSQNNTIFENNISNNWWGITSYYSTNNKIFHNNFINNPSQAYIESSVDIWDDGYPSGGNYWSDYTGADQKCGPNQDHPGSDGIVDTARIIVSNNTDRYPLMRPWTLPVGHDVSVIGVVTLKTVVGQGFGGNVTVYVANKGEYTEKFNVTTYADKAVIGTRANVTLTSGDFAILTFTWNTASVAYGNYTISAYAWPVPGETNLSDNTFTGGTIIVSHAGDINGDGVVDVSDVARVAGAFGTYPGRPKWDPNCDINNDGIIDVTDLSITCAYFGWHR